MYPDAGFWLYESGASVSRDSLSRVVAWMAEEDGSLNAECMIDPPETTTDRETTTIKSEDTTTAASQRAKATAFTVVFFGITLAFICQ